jgi:RHS repeat-associated protein
MNDSDGNTTQYTYDNDGNLRTVVLPGIEEPTGAGSAGSGGSGGSGSGFSYSYEPATSVTYSYDADGNMVSETDPNGGTTTYTYNSLNQEIAVTDPLDHTTTTTYDADGNVATVTDPLGHVTSYVYDARDQLVSETDPSGGGTTTYTYDLAGNLTSVTDPDDNVTSYTYNADNQEATETSPTGGVTTYTYDLDGDLTQTVDPLGRIIEYGYDADNRETTEKWLPVGGGTAFYTMTITYDAAGRETEVKDNDSEYSYGYNGDSEVTSISDTGTPGLPQVTLSYSYDGDGNRTSQTDSLGGIVSYTYDARDELVTESQSGTSGSGVDAELAFFDYNQDGDLTDLTRYSNLTATNEVAQTVNAYDAADRLTTTTNETSSGSTISSYVYTLDAADLLTSETRTWTVSGTTTSDTASDTYTNNDQLTSVTHTDTSFASESFSDDANGNQNSTGDSTGTGNEMTSDGTYNYTYDADGNLITKTAIATGVEDIYTYDYRNRLTEVQQVSGGVTTTLAQYTYDALNNQIEVVESGTTRYTLYDGQTPLLDFNGSGTVTARYLSVPGGIDELLARQTSAGVAWYLTDREGSVNDIINNLGTVVDHIDYSAYGTVLNESSPAVGDRFKYAGMELDSVSGLEYDRERWYNSDLGIFINKDPIDFHGNDNNLYRYTGNSPTNFTDPEGLKKYWPIIGHPISAILGVWALGPWDAWEGAFGWIEKAATAFGNDVDDYFGDSACEYGNAARHALWMALLTFFNGADQAEAFGNAHEVFDADPIDSQIDQYNNVIGRQIGTEFLNSSSYTILLSDRSVYVEIYPGLIQAMKKVIMQKLKDGSLITCKTDSRVTGPK